MEAQASGLPGIMSDTVTREAIVTDLLQVRSIKEKPELWAKEIMAKSREMGNLLEQTEKTHRENYAEKVKDASFDVKEQAKRIQEFYLTGKFL